MENKPKYDHWKKPNSRAHKKAQAEMGLPSTRKPRVGYAFSEHNRWVAFKLIDKHKKKGRRFTLTYEWIADDESKRLGRVITVRQVRDAIARLRNEGAVCTRQLHPRSKLIVFDIIDIDRLQSVHDRYDEILNLNAPKKKPIDKPVDKKEDVTLNVSHVTLNVSHGHFKREPYLNQYLNKDLNHIRRGFSNQREDIRPMPELRIPLEPAPDNPASRHIASEALRLAMRLSMGI